MKFLSLIIVSLLLISCECECAREYMYSGTIVSRGYESPTSGYKSSTKAKYFVMMREDSSQQVIRINVTVPLYHRLKDSSRASFMLSNWDLYYSGNTTDYTKNLYRK